MTGFLFGFALGYGSLMTLAYSAVSIANENVKEEIARQESRIEELHVRAMYDGYDGY